MSSVQRQDSKEDSLNVSDSWVELHFQQQPTPPADAALLSKPLPPGTIERKLLEAQRQQQQQQLTPPNIDPALYKPVSHGTMEKLLLEAQREWSRNSSRIGSNVGSTTSSRSSPKSPRSPSNEMSCIGLGESGITTIQESRVQENVDWMWDWSSRPEVIPPGDLPGARYKQPVKRAPLSVRNTKVMHSGPFSLENLPLMLLTHACTFFLGAAVMFMYLKKYCGWSSLTTTTVD